MAAAQTGAVSFIAIAVLAVALLCGSASAVDAPAPSPASGGNSLSSPVAGGLLMWIFLYCWDELTEFALETNIIEYYYCSDMGSIFDSLETFELNSELLDPLSSRILEELIKNPVTSG
ncbi:hypothetical protein M5K25_022538 [Dendrobium thyrsiflorum]|uniref:Uncharacterized protein n=1 Tax=Dendrobium thyrsiflorum TaxID=117978 RepID=A0ABD0U6G4_DENTH